jgi:hypothetical protein
VVVARTILVSENENEPEGRIWLSTTNNVRSEARRVIESMGLAETGKDAGESADEEGSSEDIDSDSGAEYNDEEEVQFGSNASNDRPKRKAKKSKVRFVSFEVEFQLLTALLM